MSGRLDAVLSRVGRLLGGRSLLAARDAVLEPPGGSSADGARHVDALVDSGAELLVVRGGASAGALACCAVLLGLEPLAAVGTDPSAVTDDRSAAGPGGWAAAVAGVRDLLPALRPLADDPTALAAACGDPRVAALAGGLAQAATRRTPVLLDGSPVTAAAALVTDRVDNTAREWWVATQRPPVPAAAASLEALALPPVLDLGLGHPDGARLVLDLLRSALRLQQEERDRG